LAGIDFVEPAKGGDGAVEIARLLEVAAGEKQIAEGAIGEVEGGAGFFVIVEVGPKGGEKGIEAGGLPAR